jgi:transposase InsO family protein
MLQKSIGPRRNRAWQQPEILAILAAYAASIRLCRELNITPKETRPYRPQTNGKIERFHRTLGESWAFSRFHSTESARRNALLARHHDYNRHEPHTAIGGKPPISRLTDLPGQYSEAAAGAA